MGRAGARWWRPWVCRRRADARRVRCRRGRAATVARMTVGQDRHQATAATAAVFLDKVIACLPFPVSGVQVDGGSEFMAGFEQACADKGLALYMLPPKTPELNGGVERCNGRWRYEFYAVYDLPRRLDELGPLVDAYADLYNTFRSHGALGGLTPTQYLQQLQAKQSPDGVLRRALGLVKKASLLCLGTVLGAMRGPPFRCAAHAALMNG